MAKILPKNAQLIPDHAKKVFQGVIFEVWQWDMKMFDGTTETFEMLKRPDTVSVFAVKNNKVVIVSELQPHWSAPKVSVTGGRVDEGEDPLDAAKRETAEELGMEFSSWKLIKVTQPFEKRNGLSIPMYVGIFQKIYRLTTIVASRLIRWK